MITLSVLEAVIQLEDVESGIGPFDSGVRVMRQSQTQTAFRREMHPNADMIAELECRTEVLVREVRAGEHRCPDTGFHVIPVRSEERRVGKECRSRRTAHQSKRISQVVSSVLRA